MTKNKKSVSVLITSALAVCMLFIMLSAWLIADTLNESRQQGLVSMQSSQLQTKNAVNLKIKGDLEILDALATFISAMDEANVDLLMSLIKDVNSRNSFIRLGLIQPDGSGYLADVDGTVYYDDFADEPVIAEALMGTGGVSNTMADRFSDHIIYIYAVPIMQEGAVIGALTATNYGVILRDIIDDASFFEAGYSHLIRSDGRYLIRSNTDYLDQEMVTIDEKIKYKNQGYDAFMADLKAFGTGLYSYNDDAGEMLLMYTPIGINDWMLVSFVPSVNLTENNYRILYGICGIVLLALLIFIFFGYQLYQINRQNVNHLKYLAYTDPLLGCANLTKFIETGEKLLQESHHNYTVWYIDITKFKYYNDIYGYDAGDALLQKLSDLFAKDPQCSLYCRVGADDFAGLLCDLDKTAVSLWFAHLCGQFDKLEHMERHGNFMRLTAGFYMPANDGSQLSLQTLINRANMAHKSGMSGRENYAFYSEDDHQRVLIENAMEAHMHTALKEHQFKVYLQPKVDIQHQEKIISAEALVRWEAALGSLTNPDLFIPLFEKNGFIVKLDRYMFTAVCSWLRQWLDAGNPPLMISINVSRLSLLCDDFLAFYTGVKAEYQIPDQLLILEFTESIVLDNDDVFAKDVLNLKAAGFICSLDDFGSGYSSLNLLKDLQIDEVKLDLVFFKKSAGLERGQIIVKNILHMAEELNIKTVAEGIEEREQVDFLKVNGCSMVQGYYFYKPVSLDAFAGIYYQNQAL